MTSKRFKDQIFGQILETLEVEGVSKTKIVYASGLNFKTIKPYLAILNKNNLIEVINIRPSKYIITQKGRDALEHIRALEALITEFKISSEET